MKKIVTLLISLLLIFTTTACAKNTSLLENQGLGEFDVVFLASQDSFYSDRNADIYEGISKYCKENNLTFNYLQAQEDSDEDRQEVMDQAINEFKASIIVSADYSWLDLISSTSSGHNNVKFILIDVPEVEMASNIAQFSLSTYDQAYLVAYVLSHEGFENIGVIFNDNQEFKDGFDDGIKYVKRNENKYPFVFKQNLYDVEDIDEVISDWFKADVEIICSCNEAITNVTTINQKYKEKYNVTYDYDLTKATYASMTKALKNFSDYSGKNTKLELSDDYISIYGNYRFIQFDKSVLANLTDELD